MAFHTEELWLRGCGRGKGLASTLQALTVKQISSSGSRYDDIFFIFWGFGIIISHAAVQLGAVCCGELDLILSCTSLPM
jgi:hypothetical protein